MKVTAAASLVLCTLALTNGVAGRALLAAKATDQPAGKLKGVAAPNADAAAAGKGEGAKAGGKSKGTDAGAMPDTMDLSGDFMYQTWMSMDSSGEPDSSGKMSLTKSEDLEGVYNAEWEPDENADEAAVEKFGVSHPGHGLLLASMVGQEPTLAGGWGIEGDDKSDDGSGVGGGVGYVLKMNPETGELMEANGKYAGVSQGKEPFQGMTKIMPMGDGASKEKGAGSKKGGGKEDGAAKADGAEPDAEAEEPEPADAKANGDAADTTTP